MRLPLIQLDSVYHIGTLDPSDVGLNSRNGSSQEGSSLSVSLCPNAWQRIARISKGDLHRLSNPNGRFLDVLDVLSDPDLKSEIFAWAVDRGYVESRVLWRFWEKNEDDVFCYTIVETEEQADREIDLDFLPEDEPHAPEGHELIEEYPSFVGTPFLQAVTGMSLGLDDPASSVVMAWALEILPAAGMEVDGIWWHETYDPHAHSAPRGCVFRERVASWSAEKTAIRGVDDEAEIAAMSGTEWTEISAPHP